MLKNPSFQSEPLRNWLQITLISLIVVLSAYFFLAAAKILLVQYGGRLPEPPAPPAELTPLASPIATESETAEPSPSATPVTGTPTALPTGLPTAETTPTPPPSPNPTPRAGTARKLEASGLTALYVPAGKAVIGDPGGSGNDAPRHAVQLSAYWINRTQVTNAQYAACVRASGCTKPIRKAINPHYYDPAYSQHPAVYITWDQARAFCQWAGGDLPTEAQWEHAATANRQQTYAWGENEPASEVTNVNHPQRGTVKVGSNKHNASPYGALDMGGNVREWVLDWYSARYYRVSAKQDPAGPASGEKKVLRGAAWSDPENFSFVWHRLAHVPGSAGANRGFRCAFPGSLGDYPVETAR